MKTLYKCKECDKEIICVQRGLSKPYEEWSRALVEHMLFHQRDGADAERESEHEKYRKFQSMLSTKEWRNYYERHFDVDDAKLFLNDDNSNEGSEFIKPKSEFYDVESISSELIKSELLITWT